MTPSWLWMYIRVYEQHWFTLGLVAAMRKIIVLTICVYFVCGVAFARRSSETGRFQRELKGHDASAPWSKVVPSRGDNDVRSKDDHSAGHDGSSRWSNVVPSRRGSNVRNKADHPAGYDLSDASVFESQFLVDTGPGRHGDRHMEWRRGHGMMDQPKGDPCPQICNLDYRPVCGSDGRTYANRCEMSAAACSEKRRIFMEREGRCDDVSSK